MLRTCGQITDITGADLWVMDPAVRYIDDVKPMLENNLYRVRGVEGVRWAVPLYKGTARVKINPDVSRGNQPTVIEQVILLGLDDATPGGCAAARKMLAGNLRDLRLPDADHRRQRPARRSSIPMKNGMSCTGSARRFYQQVLRRQLEMNDHRAIIVGVCEATRTFQIEPGRLHDLRPGQEVRSPGAEDSLLHPGQDASPD